MFLPPIREYLIRLAEPRTLADIALVFLLVYGVLKLLRGTRAAPMAAALGVFGFLYWLSIYARLVTLEFVLRGALLYIGVAIIILFQTEIRQGLINAAGDCDEQQPAFAFLLGIAKNDQDWESRRNAVRQLGQFQREDAIDELMKIFSTDSNLEVKRTALRALAETKSPRAQARLLEIAKTDNNPELRKQAIRVLSERGEAAVDDLVKLFDSEQSQDVRRTALQALSEIKSPRVEDKLFAVAGGNDNIEVRKQAIRLLGERVGRKSLEFLGATAQSADGNAEVQMQAVRSIGEHHSEESVPLLIKIAKTHPNQLVRKQAIRSLGDSGDPRAVEFFREVLAKE